MVLSWAPSTYHQVRMNPPSWGCIPPTPWALLYTDSHVPLAEEGQGLCALLQDLATRHRPELEAALQAQPPEAIARLRQALAPA